VPILIYVGPVQVPSRFIVRRSKWSYILKECLESAGPFGSIRTRLVIWVLGGKKRGSFHLFVIFVRGEGGPR